MSHPWMYTSAYKNHMNWFLTLTGTRAREYCKARLAWTLKWVLQYWKQSKNVGGEVLWNLSPLLKADSSITFLSKTNFLSEGSTWYSFIGRLALTNTTLTGRRPWELARLGWHGPHKELDCVGINQKVGLYKTPFHWETCPSLCWRSDRSSTRSSWWLQET